MEQRSPFVPVGTIANADNISAVREDILTFYVRFNPNDGQTANDMVPDRLSPNGQLPVTHYLCFTKVFWTPEMIEQGRDYMAGLGHPVIIEQSNSRAELLNKYKLKQIE